MAAAQMDVDPAPGLAKPSNASSRPHAPSFDVNALLAEILRTAATDFAQRGDIKLEAVLDPSLPAMQGLPQDLREIMEDLVANARIGMPAGGAIKVTTKHVVKDTDAYGIEITVLDEGPALRDPDGTVDGNWLNFANQDQKLRFAEAQRKVAALGGTLDHVRQPDSPGTLVRMLLWSRDRQERPLRDSRGSPAGF
jgi:hypothetical protein